MLTEDVEQSEDSATEGMQMGQLFGKWFDFSYSVNHISTFDSAIPLPRSAPKK